MVKRMPNRDLAYFRDDQMLFLVTHESPTISDDQLETFRSEMSKNLQAWTLTTLPRAFSFPATVVDDPEKRLGELHDLDLNAGNEDLKKRRKELQALKSLLSDNDWKNGPDELKEIKKAWKTDRNWQELLMDEVNRREGLLDESQTSAVDQPKLFNRPYSILLCDLNVPPPNVAHDPLLDTIQSLRRKLGEPVFKDRTFGGMKIEDMSPNWLMTVSSQGGATGGPGALPMPFDPLRDGSPL